MTLATPTVKRHAPLILFVLFFCAFWLIMGWRSACFSIVNDAYQYSAPFALQHSFLNFSIPLIGDFLPYSDHWGYQWPFYMILKSGLYAVIPYSPSLDKLLSLAFVSLGGITLFAGLSRIMHRPWAGLLCAIAYMMDEILSYTSESTRPEPLTALLLMGVLFAVELLAAGKHRQRALAFLALAFFLLPGLHPHGLTIAGGLVVLHWMIFRRWNSGGKRFDSYVPLVAYVLGILVFLSWFQLFPVAGEQMRVNRLVQALIYETATRFTFFQMFLPRHLLWSGYVLWVPAIILSLAVAFRFLLSYGKSGGPLPRPCLVYSAAIIGALPVLGFIFRIDNYWHFAIGLPAAYLILGAFAAKPELPQAGGDRWRVPILGFLAFSGMIILALAGARYVRAGCPVMVAEQKKILSNYSAAPRIYIPLTLWESAIAVRPDSARFFTFPLPMLRKVREQYEAQTYAEAKSGDVMLVELSPGLDRLQMQPCGQFDPPDPKEWEFVARHLRNPPWNWDILAYRKK